MFSLEKIIKLPAPRKKSNTSIEETLTWRRSVRTYSDAPLTLADISQLLWSAQGITNSEGYRTAPSAGALFPLEVYLAAGHVENLINGVYKYHPSPHELTLMFEGDKRADLSRASLDQECILKSSASIVIAAVFERITVKYGKRGIMYVHMEAGHAAQNIHLQAEALNIGSVVIGAFYDEKVKNIFRLPLDEKPLIIMPLGKK